MNPPATKESPRLLEPESDIAEKLEPTLWGDKQLMNANPIFQPFRLKSLVLKNRIVMAPMTRSFSPDGVPTLKVADYYARRAEGEVGLILSEGTVVNRPASSNDPNIPHLWPKTVGGVEGRP
jgi:2,4-dienoyl-CoA reductase-like NADH-dependent reductase (Old Yellow Enzyme family)